MPYESEKKTLDLSKGFEGLPKTLQSFVGKFLCTHFCLFLFFSHKDNQSLANSSAFLTGLFHSFLDPIPLLFFSRTHNNGFPGMKFLQHIKYFFCREPQQKRSPQLTFSTDKLQRVLTVSHPSCSCGWHRKNGEVYYYVLPTLRRGQ